MLFAPPVIKRIGPLALSKPVRLKMICVVSVGMISGTTRERNSRNGPHPSSFAASSISVGIRAIEPHIKSIIVEKPVHKQ